MDKVTLAKAMENVLIKYEGRLPTPDVIEAMNDDINDLATISGQPKLLLIYNYSTCKFEVELMPERASLQS